MDRRAQLPNTCLPRIYDQQCRTCVEYGEGEGEDGRTGTGDVLRRMFHPAVVFVSLCCLLLSVVCLLPLSVVCCLLSVGG